MNLHDSTTYFPAIWPKPEVMKMSMTAKLSDTVHTVVTGMASRSMGKPVTIAPGIARRILDECNFTGQRKIQRLRQSRHERRIRTGKWWPEVSVITFARTPDGKLHLVNGQHRLSAIDGVQIAAGSTIHIIDVSSMEDVRRLYTTFDDPTTGRGDVEVIGALEMADKLGLTNKITAALFKAMTLLLNDLEPMGPADKSVNARERDVRLEAMSEWGELAKVYSAYVYGADKDVALKLLTQGVMASALYTLRHQPVVAADFWGGLAANDGLRRNDPRARLLNDFRNRDTSSGNIRQRVQRVSVAWNAFFENRDLSIIKCIEGRRIVFAGTPKGAK